MLSRGTTSLLLALAAGSTGTAAGAPPVSYWRFEDPATPGANSAAGGAALDPKTKDAWVPKAFADGGIVGGFISVQNATLAAAGGPFPRSSAASGVTVEFLFRAGRDFQRFGNTTLFGVIPTASPSGGWIEAGLLRHSLVWRADASLSPDDGACSSEQDAVIPSPVPCSRLEVPMDQSGRRSMFYLDDGLWHHLAFRKQAVTGEQSIWIDGQAPDGFTSPFAGSATGPFIPQPHAGGTPQPFELLPDHFDGAIDEVALWDEALPDAVIAQHHADAMAHKPYTAPSMVNLATPVPSPAPVAGLLRATDFAVGTVCPGWTSNCTPAVCNHSWPFQGAGAAGITRGDSTQLSALQQLRAFPAPRLLPGTLPHFGYNIPWFPVGNAGAGEDSPVACPRCHNQSCTNSLGDPCWNVTGGYFESQAFLMQEELTAHWHFPWFISHDGLPSNRTTTGTNWQARTIDLFNSKPDIPMAHTISRGDISTMGCPGGKALDISVVNRPECFLQNAKGQALLPDGNPRPRTTCNTTAHGPNCCSQPGTGGRCVLRPCVSCKYDCMDALATQDALKYKAKWESWQAAGLKRPLELLFDDGEYLGWYNNLAHALDRDPVMVQDYTKLAIPRLPGTGAGGQRDWATYTSMWRAKNTETFKRALLSGAPEDLTYNATYGEYTVGGDTLFRPDTNDSWLFVTAGKWQAMREINSPGRTSHSSNYYGMSDY